MSKPPRKDYGCPLRIYQDALRPSAYTILPPRSGLSMERWRSRYGWDSLYITEGLCTRQFNNPGPHLGQRIHWNDLPPSAQRALRASAFGQYCPPISHQE